MGIVLEGCGMVGAGCLDSSSASKRWMCVSLVGVVVGTYHFTHEAESDQSDGRVDLVYLTNDGVPCPFYSLLVGRSDNVGY